MQSGESMSVRLVAALWALVIGVLATAAPSVAAPRDAVFNKEGVWGIDVDGGSCAASMMLKDGSTFLLRGTAGAIHVALFARAKLPRGQTARIETEAYGFAFKPGWGEGGDTLYTAEPIDARAVATLRLARQVRMVVDDRAVMTVTVEGTGFEQALDGVIACSNGQRGWWGEGVATAPAASAPVAADAPTYRNEGVWTVAADKDVCTAVADAGDERSIVLIAANGGQSIMIGVGGKLGERGHKGRFETDAYGFAFVPTYDGDDYVSIDEFLDAQALAALRRAKMMRISIDGRAIIEADLDGTGFAGVIDSLTNCAAGKRGWWGVGAKR